MVLPNKWGKGGKKIEEGSHKWVAPEGHPIGERGDMMKVGKRNVNHLTNLHRSGRVKEKEKENERNTISGAVHCEGKGTHCREGELD